MSKAINQELLFFLSSILTGVLIALLYDIIRIIRRLVKHGSFWVALEDTVYWIGSALVVFIMMYEKNDGAIRGFSIAGIILGMIVYNGSVSRILVRYISIVLNGIIHILYKVFRILTTPFRFLFRKFGVSVKWTKKKAGKTSNIFLKRLKKILKEVRITLKFK
jgi:spore cortex biosynthesis protein YabQ